MDIIRSRFPVLLLLLFAIAVQAGEDYVILLHGLGRTASCFSSMQKELERDHYRVINLDYESRKMSIEAVADSVLDPVVRRIHQEGNVKIHFVTHSMGGIVVRYYLQKHVLKNPGRLVMLGPPSQGSEMADFTDRVWPANWFMGANLNRLKTDKNSLVNTLPAPPVEFGIIAGDRSINWINTLWIIPGKDDGKVSVECAKLDGMKDFLVVHVSHPFLMQDAAVIAQVKAFLRNGAFAKPASE